jgi:methylated-DNA-[protein]-cysteine S-methyltransferase
MPPPAELQQTSLATPVGELTLIASGSGLRAVRWPGEADGAMVERLASPLGSAPARLATLAEPAAILHAAVAQLHEYFSGMRTTFDLPLDPRGTPFQRAAWEVLGTIPFGETISYGEQARRLGDHRKARAVGAANGRNPIPIIIPCHRVIGADGSLTGFAAGTDAKAWLLGHEIDHSAGRLPFTDGSP